MSEGAENIDYYEVVPYKKDHRDALRQIIKEMSPEAIAARCLTNAETVIKNPSWRERLIELLDEEKEHLRLVLIKNPQAPNGGTPVGFGEIFADPGKKHPPELSLWVSEEIQGRGLGVFIIENLLYYCRAKLGALFAHAVTLPNSPSSKIFKQLLTPEEADTSVPGQEEFKIPLNDVPKRKPNRTYRLRGGFDFTP